MGKRHDAIGIKQVVRLEWYDFVLDLVQDGRDAKAIRSALDAFLTDRRQSGGYGERGQDTYVKAVTQLMKCWVSPDKELMELRDSALAYSRHCPRDKRLALHWAMTIAAYPFWYKVAEQVGRLLTLQQMTSQSQIRRRCFEVFGERTTVERSARRVVRSFVAWGVLKDSDTKGCYEKSDPLAIPDHDVIFLLIEAALHALPEGKAALGVLINAPAFFPFQFPMLNGNLVAQRAPGIDVVRYGLDDELIRLRRIK